jgi:NTE family protein
MENKLAFVLSGGGSRGALQVGALHALFERGLQPDFLIGSSVGSVNAAYLALHGYSQATLDQLTEVWRHASSYDLLPKNYIWLAMRSMLRRSSNDPAQRLRQFFIHNGLTPDLRFGQLHAPNLFVVAADLNTGKPVIHGLGENEKVLDALLLSTALPPWFMPVREQGAYLVDGGIVSNLPIEPALHMGATQIIALDLLDTHLVPAESSGLGGFLGRLTYAVERRHAALELELAEARGIPTLYLGLGEKTNTPFWDFQHTDEMLEQGYAIARHILDGQKDERLLKLIRE